MTKDDEIETAMITAATSVAESVNLRSNSTTIGGRQTFAAALGKQRNRKR